MSDSDYRGTVVLDDVVDRITAVYGSDTFEDGRYVELALVRVEDE